MSGLIILNQWRLKLHPKNIRLYYAPNDVAEMARSLAAMGKMQETGNIQALLVTPVDLTPQSPLLEGEGGQEYWVIDGNLRLAAGRSLGEACPLFKCEVIEASQAEQLLMMAATGLHFPKDSISQGRHFRRLIDEEGFTQGEIAAQTGLSVGTISKCLAALELDTEIQQLIVEKKLTDDIRVIRALKAIPEKAQRLHIAQYYAGRDTAIGSMVRRMRMLVERTHQVNGNGAAYQEAQAKIKARVEAVQQTKTQQQKRLNDEAREVIWEIAERMLCEDCRLNGLTAKCYLCPGPQEFIEHLVELAEVAEIQKQPAVNGK